MTNAPAEHAPDRELGSRHQVLPYRGAMDPASMILGAAIAPALRTGAGPSWRRGARDDRQAGEQ